MFLFICLFVFPPLFFLSFFHSFGMALFLNATAGQTIKSKWCTQHSHLTLTSSTHYKLLGCPKCRQVWWKKATSRIYEIRKLTCLVVISWPSCKIPERKSCNLPDVHRQTGWQTEFYFSLFEFGFGFFSVSAYHKFDWREPYRVTVMNSEGDLMTDLTQ